ncbi:AAA family ATPase [Paenibacillus sp. KQZ6P-2]|uniref:AAA family ATPase n=1 Tax=Paenibacillus mangrovi TaxID=2931978 RepID=A0A9X2B0Z9_9BACL|nr:AAA family ATPase [Paenibacillus mangrovi]MCJ8010395.1 AAA family ATPase [Paenibacillus mangrovi]
MKRLMKRGTNGCNGLKRWPFFFSLAMKKEGVEKSMRIERLHIHGFGRIKEQEIQFNSPLTVLAGPNEAGKSTILMFVRAMLYGIPSRAFPAERYEPSGGGSHGGMLVAEAADGSKWTITRYAAPERRTGSGRSEQPTIVKTNPQGTAIHMTQHDLEKELLGGMSRDMFNQLFAVTLTELQEIRTLQSGDMGSYLFHAGFGGGTEIVRAERKLVQNMEKLYKPRGRVQESAKVLQRMEQLQREISESRSYLSKYIHAESKLSETQQTIADVDIRRTDLSRQLAVLHKAQEIRQQWLEWKEASIERGGISGEVSFPEEGLSRLERLREERNRIDIRLEELERALEEWKKQLAKLQTDELLISQGPVIERLAARREMMEIRIRELQELSGEEAALKEQLQRLLRQIHPGWGQLELRSFSGAVSERESVRRYAAGFAGYDRRMEGFALEREQKNRQLESAEYELERAEAAVSERKEAGKIRFHMIIPQTRTELLTAWQELQSEAERWRESRLSRVSAMNYEEQEALVSGRMRALYRKLLWGSAVLTLAFPAILWIMKSPWGALAAFLVFIIADVLLWRGSEALPGNSTSRSGRRKNGSLYSPETGEERISHLMSSLVSDPLTASASSDGPFTRSSSISDQDMESSLRELRKLVDARLLWHEELEQLSADADGVRQQAELFKRERLALIRKMDGEQHTFEQLDSQWRCWLVERGLEEGSSPETVMDMFGFAEQGMELVRRLDVLGRKWQALKQEIDAFEKECLTILPEHEVLDLHLLSHLGMRMRSWEEQQHLLHKREVIGSKLEPVQEEMFRLEREKSRLERVMQSLLDEAQAADEEEFLRIGAVSERRKELERMIRQLEVNMFSGWSGDREQALLNVLNHYDQAALDEACIRAEEEMSSAEKRWNELQQQRGRLLQERDHLVRLCSHDTALQQLEEERAHLKEIASEYAVLSICAEMIARTRGIYEQEKQPQVLKLASTYFHELTRGSYSRIVMKMGEKRLLAEHRDGSLIDSSLLSRGTAEQLYLAMRFALAGSMNSQVSVPLILDDLFVNFDEDRMCSALDVAGRMAENKQIILLTCHRYMTDHVQRRLPQAEIIRI